MTSETSVSLLEHLHASLLPLLNLEAFAPSLRAELGSYVKPSLSESSSEIPYGCLLRVSRWASTAEGKPALIDASLDPSDYLMISLLAGLVTSPSAVLGFYNPPPSAQELRRTATRDRRAILALVNALFSVIGVGVAVWRASSTAGWSDGTRVLWALCAGYIVAFAEGGLYYIWNQRASSKKGPSRLGPTTKVLPPLVSLEIPADSLDEQVRDTDELPDGLRRRAVPSEHIYSASSS